MVKTLIIIAFLVCGSSCFGGVDNRGSVRSYGRGIVSTEGGGKLSVGRLPPGWKYQKTPLKAILFVHQERRSSIAVDAFCFGRYDDAPLEILSNQLFYGMTDQQIREGRKMTLDGHEALRASAWGKMDGKPVVLDSVVLKTHECIFDFTYVATPEEYHLGVADFVSFYQGFHMMRRARDGS